MGQKHTSLTFVKKSGETQVKTGRYFLCHRAPVGNMPTDYLEHKHLTKILTADKLITVHLVL